MFTNIDKALIGFFAAGASVWTAMGFEVPVDDATIRWVATGIAGLTTGILTFWIRNKDKKEE